MVYYRFFSYYRLLYLDPKEFIFATQEVLEKYLNVDKVSFAEVDEEGKWGLIERYWNNGWISRNANRHILSDFGTLWDDLK